jgi:ppGpp synthetase/RelA/SpoT-type nucleotidyltranferase
MQDIAGARVVAEMTRNEQDELVTKIKQLYPEAREIDRRVRPSFGYRAVHVVVTAEGRLVEIQVRTELQNLWAQLLERLADQWGRQIRYGGPPNNADEMIAPKVTRQDIVNLLIDVSTLIDEREGLAADLCPSSKIYNLGLSSLLNSRRRCRGSRGVRRKRTR